MTTMMLMLMRMAVVEARKREIEKKGKGRGKGQEKGYIEKGEGERFGSIPSLPFFRAFRF